MIARQIILTEYAVTIMVFFIGWIVPTTVQASDGYIERKENSWMMGTGLVEKTVVLEKGRFFLKSFVDKTTGSELIGTGSGEFFVTLADNDEPLTGLSGGWKLVDSQTRKLKQGELQLSITLNRDNLQVTKNYIIFPLTSVIREWVVFKNVGEEPLNIGDPSFLNYSFRLGDPADVDFLWVTGGTNAPGSWLLYKEQLKPDNPREFDSYDPLRTPANIMDSVAGDGVQMKIFHNEKQVWPENGWVYSPHSAVMPKFEIEVDVKQGNELIFLVNGRENILNDRSEFGPEVYASDGKAFLSWGYFSDKQGGNNWSYYAYKDGERVEMVFNAGIESENWQGFDKVKDKDNLRWLVPGRSWHEGPYIGWNYVCPGDGYDVARVWTAEKDDKVKVKGSICNIYNYAGNARFGFSGGSGSYAPWTSLYNQNERKGLFIGWDYFGRWNSQYTINEDGWVSVRMKVMNFHANIASGESFTTPKAFVGLYQGDLDDAGNACLDWQYRYLWDYTRDGWFPAIRMLGNWPRGVSAEGNDLDSVYRKAFRVVDMMRYVGGDVYHRDYGWWDRMGDWNGPDWRSVNNYLQKYDMGLLLYGTLNYAHRNSRVGRQVPDGYPAGTDTGYWMDCGKEQTVEVIKNELDRWYDQWGPFSWRNDGGFIHPHMQDDTPEAYQDQGFRKIIKDFLDKHPDCAFQSVNGGGPFAGYDYTRFSSSTSFSDGGVGILQNYYASLLLPPDKTSDIPDISRPESYDKATWRVRLCTNFDMSGDTYDYAKLEGLRELIDIYHYLQHNGVVGRWVKVYRPYITGDDPTMYFQRLSGDQLRGVIIPKRLAGGPVTIKPKGLSPKEIYTVSFHESGQTETSTGADLMDRGIQIEKMLPGELIYLNLPLHPGSKLDTESPSAPKSITKRNAKNMGYPGIEIKWNPGQDNHWISYYELFRDGVVIDKLAKGTFYFDHSVGADLAANYEVRTVDGAGNVSAKATAIGLFVERAKIFDDTDSDIVFKGNWELKRNIASTHAGTLTRSNQIGDTFELTFEGEKVSWFTKLGPDCGKALVTVGHGDHDSDSGFGEAGYTYAEVVDTYSADEIHGICLYQKEWPEPGRYTIRITVLDEHDFHPADPEALKDNSKATWVHVDGLRVE